MNDKTIFMIYAAPEKIYTLKGFTPSYRGIAKFDSELIVYAKKDFYKNMADYIDYDSDIYKYTINVGRYTPLGEKIAENVPYKKSSFGYKNINRADLEESINQLQELVNCDNINYFNKKQETKIQGYMSRYYEKNFDIDNNLIPYVYAIKTGLEYSRSMWDDP